MLEMNEKLRFSSEIEKRIHKIVSVIKYGETIRIDIEGNLVSDKDTIVKAIKKSAQYNCLTVKTKWSKDKDHVLVTHEL